MTTVLLLHGPNLNLLGEREPHIYGTDTLDDYVAFTTSVAEQHGLTIEAHQSNHEGELIDHIHGARGRCAAIIINPGAFTHYAWAIHDALELTGLPAVEVHLSDVMHREEFRRVSVVRELCVATISGQGVDGYREALSRLKEEFQA